MNFLFRLDLLWSSQDIDESDIWLWSSICKILWSEFFLVIGIFRFGLCCSSFDSSTFINERFLDSLRFFDFLFMVLWSMSIVRFSILKDICGFIIEVPRRFFFLGVCEPSMIFLRVDGGLLFYLESFAPSLVSNSCTLLWITLNRFKMLFWLAWELSADSCVEFWKSRFACCIRARSVWFKWSFICWICCNDDSIFLSSWITSYLKSSLSTFRFISYSKFFDVPGEELSSGFR